jgi:hypothetical protein
MTQGHEAGTEELSARDKIQILLAEYNTLRAEVLMRGGTALQVTAIAAALLALLLQRDTDLRFWLGFGVLVCGVVTFTWIIAGNIGKLAGRIRELEQDINTRAREPLLCWETKHGEAYGEGQVGVFSFFVRYAHRIDAWLQRRLRK